MGGIKWFLRAITQILIRNHQQVFEAYEPLFVPALKMAQC